jgi:hypothetical protein
MSTPIPSEEETYVGLQESMKSEGKELTRQRLFLQSLKDKLKKEKMEKLVSLWMEMRGFYANFEEYTAKVHFLAEQIALYDFIHEKVPGTKVRSFKTAMDHQKKYRNLYFEKHFEFHTLLSKLQDKLKPQVIQYSPTKGFRV